MTVIRKILTNEKGTQISGTNFVNYYNFIQRTSDSVIIYEKNAKVYYQLNSYQLNSGTYLNAINKFLYNGAWISYYSQAKSIVIFFFYFYYIIKKILIKIKGQYGICMDGWSTSLFWLLTIILSEVTKVFKSFLKV